MLDVLIPTLYKRKHLLYPLLDELERQIKGYPVKVLTYPDNGVLKIGHKRNELLSWSKAKYVVFIDDDDKIDSDYIETLLPELKVDAVGFKAKVFNNGVFMNDMEFKDEYDRYFMEDGIFKRPIGHLCPIRRDIATLFKFNDNPKGSDRDWCLEIKKSGKIKTSTFIDKYLYFYYYIPQK